MTEQVTSLQVTKFAIASVIITVGFVGFVYLLTSEVNKHFISYIAVFSVGIIIGAATMTILVARFWRKP